MELNLVLKLLSNHDEYFVRSLYSGHFFITPNCSSDDSQLDFPNLESFPNTIKRVSLQKTSNNIVSDTNPVKND